MFSISASIFNLPKTEKEKETVGLSAKIVSPLRKTVEGWQKWLKWPFGDFK